MAITSDKVLDMVLTLRFAQMGSSWSRTNKIWWGIPSVWYSGPGRGKTSHWRQLAKLLVTKEYPDGIPYECLKYGARGEGQFGVVPTPVLVPHPDYPKSHPEWKQHALLGIDYPAPAHYMQRYAKGIGVLNVGETNTAPAAIAAAQCAMMQEREWGAWFMGEDGSHPYNRIFLIGDANPTEQAAGARDFEMNLANRMAHFEYPGHTAQEWGRWLTAGANGGEITPIDCDAEEARIMKVWPDVWAKAAGIAATFVDRKSDCFVEELEANDPRSSKAWASERTWEYAVRLFATSMARGLDVSTTDDLISGCIGSDIALQFSTFRNDLDLPDPVEFMSGIAPFQHSLQRLDRTHALMETCKSRILSPETKTDKKTKKMWASTMWKFLDVVTEDAADLAAPIVKTLWEANIVSVDEAKPVLIKMEPIIRPTT